MRNKWLTIVITSLFLFGMTVTTMIDVVDAKGRGSFRSGVKKYKPNPNKFNSSNSANRANRSNDTKTSNTMTTQKRGFFGDGSLMRGLMIGGIAGLLFGGLSNLGFFGNILGVMINVFTLLLLISLVIFIIQKLKNRRKSSTPEHGRWWH